MIKYIIYTVVTRLEISRMNNEIHKIDPNAFVIMTAIKDVKGGMIKKRQLETLGNLLLKLIPVYLYL